jgi:hypothetical protein
MCSHARSTLPLHPLPLCRCLGKVHRAHFDQELILEVNHNALVGPQKQRVHEQLLPHLPTPGIIHVGEKTKNTLNKRRGEGTTQLVLPNCTQVGHLLLDRA